MATKIEEKMAAEGYMKATKAASLVGRTVYTIYRWIEAEGLVGKKVMGRWYVTTDSLVAKIGPDAARVLGLDAGGADAVAGTQPNNAS